MNQTQFVRLSLGAAMFRALMCSVLVLAASASSQAAPVNYDEMVDGDLTAYGTLPVLLLDVGVNTVRGNLGYTDPGPTDWDSFAFSVPAGTELSGAVVTLTDVLGNISSAKWRFRAGSNSWDTGTLLEQIEPLSPGATVFSTTPLGPDVYNLSIVSFGFFPGSTNNTTNYEFSFRVAAVPEPSTMILAASGLLGFAWVNFRKRQRLISSAEKEIPCGRGRDS